MMPTVESLWRAPAAQLIPMIDVCALLVTVFMQFLAWFVMPRRVAWSRRREIQLLILALPALTIVFSLPPLLVARPTAGCDPWAVACASGSRLPLILSGIEVALAVLPTAVAAGALVLGTARLILMWRVVSRRGVLAPKALLSRAARLATCLGVRAPHVYVCALDQPLALTYGVLRPTVVLSRWMVEHLDARELDAVLAHELAHAARHDFVVLWIASVLRDAFFYLPASRAAYRLLRDEKELACDDLAIATTRRPLGLASALAKVWHEATTAPGAPEVLGVALAQPLLGAAAHAAVEGRLVRLLEPPASAPGEMSHCRLPHAGTAHLCGLLALASAGLVFGLALMGCAPALIGR